MIQMPMVTEILKVDSERPDKGKLVAAAKVIGGGGLVGFPTETVYGIACLARRNSLERLSHLKDRPGDKYYTVHIGDKRDVDKYVPSMGLRARKLVDRGWPGPLTIVFEIPEGDLGGLKEVYGGEVFENLYRDGSIGVRCPDNAAGAMLLGLVDGPVVVPSANISGEEPAVSAEEVYSRFSGQIELVVDAGVCKYGKSSTVVKFSGGRLDVVREGVYGQRELERLSEVQILVVCTGNTCRSPMAEGFMRKYLAEKMGCDVDEVEEKGYKVCSAGTMGISGVPVSPEAVSVCAAKGVDIKGHLSTGLSEQLIDESDIVYVVSRAHGERIIALSGGAADRCMLLLEDKEVSDPIGRSEDFYEDCAEVIESAVRRRIGGLEL